ncbi:MAG TPA: flavodoxin domain-containing protein, partial [Dehalococcoidia bacterium]|nr:flavodoxin domain-containing protein [Dehalococcoidia bacterium]
MKALVVFESMFGNNQRIAEAIAQGLSEHMAVEVLEVGTAPTSLADDVALLVVGAPTHMLGMSQPSSRKRAAGQSDRPVVSSGIGVREWLESLNVPPRSTAGAAFDTRLSTRWLRPFPSAAGKIDKGLRKRGIQTML